LHKQQYTESLNLHSCTTRILGIFHLYFE
jgi:hypothetical protein